MSETNNIISALNQPLMRAILAKPLCHRRRRRARPHSGPQRADRAGEGETLEDAIGISTDLAATCAEATLRRPAVGDAAKVWRLVREVGSLDANSPYAYLLLCSDFADTGIVAETRGRLVGFALGYRPPARPDTLFVWQIAVSPEHRGERIASRLLGELIERTRSRGVRFVEATVTPGNRASAALFRGVAQRRGVPVREIPAFSHALFPGGDHEDEIRLRIGPVTAAG